eukprot:scaffold300376_cov26-Tisochrysis_lutea.AAC.1
MQPITSGRFNLRPKHKHSQAATLAQQEPAELAHVLCAQNNTKSAPGAPSRRHVASQRKGARAEGANS